MARKHGVARRIATVVAIVLACWALGSSATHAQRRGRGAAGDQEHAGRGRGAFQLPKGSAGHGDREFRSERSIRQMVGFFERQLRRGN